MSRVQFLAGIDATETDTLRVGVVQDLDGIAVEDSHNSSGEVSSKNISWDERGRQQQESCPVQDHGRRKGVTNYHRAARR